MVSLDRSVVVAACLVVAALALAGCVHDGGGGSDGPAPAGNASAPDDANDTTAPDDATGNASEDDDGDGANETPTDDGTADAPEPPSTLDEDAVARGVRSRVRSYRRTTGFRETRHAQGLVTAAADTNRRLAEADVAPPLDANGTAFGLDEAALLERYVAAGAEECERSTDEVVGLLAAARDVRAVDDDPSARGATLEDRIVDHVAFAWKRGGATRPVVERDYRYDGVDARYDAARGVVYVTAAFC